MEPASKSLERPRILGCLIGGAIGDALGAPVEFDSLERIRHRFGPRGLEGFSGLDGIPATITDDTQMTLFTAEGLIRAAQRSVANTVRDPVTAVWNAYLRWLDTQEAAHGVIAAERALTYERRGWLVDEPVLRWPRAPGRTCLNALWGGRPGSREDPLNDSKGCGGVMRVAPVGLVEPEPFGLGSEIAALTHGHPSGYLAAGAFAQMIGEVSRGGDLRSSADGALRRASEEPEAEEVVAAIGSAIRAADDGEASADTVETLGAGWVAEEALAIALYCALVEPDPPRALLLAVNHSGDSDSTGSLAGQLLGAIHGPSVFPEEWLARIDAREVVERVAEDLARRFIDDHDLDWSHYPGG